MWTCQCPKTKRGRNKSTKTMEGNYLTAGDLALIENRRGYGYGDGYENTSLYHRADASFFEVLQSLLGRPKDGAL